jgi:hypothetical protein
MCDIIVSQAHYCHDLGSKAPETNIWYMHRPYSHMCACHYTMKCYQIQNATSATNYIHNRTQLFCRVFQALGKLFAECNSWQIGLGELYIGNGFFAEYFLSGARQRLFRVPPSSRQRKVTVTAPSDCDEAFVECPP